MSILATVPLALFSLASAGSLPVRPVNQFSQAEVAAIQKLWQAPGRYSSGPAGSEGAQWCVRLTPAGSIWIRELYRQFQPGKVIPTSDPAGSTAKQREWVEWLDRQVQRDTAEAQAQADGLNSGRAVREAVAERAATLNRRAGVDKTGREPAPAPVPQDDPCPAELVGLLGAPPKFAAPVRPNRHHIVFPDGTAVDYVDNVRVRAKYAYYRFADGVNSEGESVKKLASSAVDSLCRSAGISQSEQRVMRAVSMLEGGFDSVNTYDTGYVSAGFIQFACLKDGTGSLGEMLRHYKSTNSKGFQADFRAYGLDVVGEQLVAVDLETGEEKTGPDAAMAIIHDKRLIAVFQRAGLKSTAYRVAQLQAARNQFYPLNETVDVRLGDGTFKVKVRDFVRTEAGLATLMDRKVNTGKLAGLKEAVERVAADFAITQPSDLADIEYQIVKSMVYRQDYLATSELNKPRDNSVALSRRGTRAGRSRGL